MMCLAPVVFLGYVATIQTDWHHSADVSGAYAEVQSCRDGLGAHLKAGQGAWVAGGIHYGLTKELADGWAVTLQPAMGLSYSNTFHPMTHVRQITRFELGFGAVVSKHDWMLGVEYLHQSNGEGWEPTNVGLDGIGVKVGRRF